MYTGTDLPIAAVIVIAAVVVAVGIAMLVSSRRRKRAIAVVGLLLILTVVLATIAAFPSRVQAAEPSSKCVGSTNSISVTQTSAIAGMGPGSAAAPVTGFVTNGGATPVALDRICVTISGTSMSRGISEACPAIDFSITGNWMPIKAMLASGESVPFAGAFIRFLDQNNNQDTCKNAALHLGFDLIGD
ncbi:hypothetical protein SAMN06296378_2435 [Salinibacterium xinjiangense]|uniref:Uncharacterized protein n=1 Tax=Salinibacterium xinjiangense TaxID=386302 RepID=A0A2C9A0A3_9MICO|nr:hypothetical protein SAMN06296378_2435 [Salinibacterium xinjiangense]